MDSLDARVDKQVYITHLGIKLADIMNFDLTLLRTIHVRVAHRIVYSESAIAQWLLTRLLYRRSCHPIGHSPKTLVVEGMTAVAMIKFLMLKNNEKRKYRYRLFANVVYLGLPIVSLTVVSAVVTLASIMVIVLPMLSVPIH